MAIPPAYESARPAPGYAQLEEMDPGERSQNWMSVLSMGLLVAGLVVGAALAAWHAVTMTLTLTPRSALAVGISTIIATALTMLVHEALHGLGMVAFGARPRFGVGVMHTGLPYLYTTAHGHRFTKGQFLAIAALPNVVVNLGLVVLLLFGPHPAWWVVPLAMHLSGCVGDAWLCWAALHEMRGTMIEDLRGGMRVHRPRERPGRPNAVPAT